jgi:acyl-CoA dehydrogenase
MTTVRDAPAFLTEEDRAVQAKARALADELIPHEVDAELNDGELPGDVTKEHVTRAEEMGLTAINVPTEFGGRGYTYLQQVLIQEQIGRVTNGLGWVVTTPAGWLPKVASDRQME